MTNASLRKRFDLPASGASQVSKLIKTCISSNLLKIADPDAGKRYADVYLEVQHPCWSCNSNSSSANASAGVR